MSITATNKAGGPQALWQPFMAPATVVDRLPEIGLAAPENWPFIKGPLVGDRRRCWLRPTLDGLESASVRKEDIQPSKAEEIAFITGGWTLDWLLDKPEDVVVKLQVISFTGDGPTLQFKFLHVVEDHVGKGGPAVWLWEAQSETWHAYMFTTLAPGQDSVPWQLLARRHNAKSEEWSSRLSVFMEHGEWHVIDYAATLRQSAELERLSTLLGDATIMDGMAIVAYGAMIAEQDAPTTDFEDKHPKLHDQIRYDRAKARSMGPIEVMLRGEWDGNLGPYGSRISVMPQEPEVAGWSEDVTPWDAPFHARPLANAVMSGQTGAQPGFGVMKGLSALRLDPGRAVPFLRHVVTDYAYRCHHFRDEDGKPWRPETAADDRRLTYGMAPFLREAASAEAWGKDHREPDVYAIPHGTRNVVDDQHRGAIIHGLAMEVLGDFIHGVMLDDILAADLRGVRIRRGQFDATRAGGRMLQEWAHLWPAADQRQRGFLLQLMERNLEILESQPTMAEGRAVRFPMLGEPKQSPSNRFWNPAENIGKDYWPPWEASFVVAGCAAAASALRRSRERPDLVTRFLKAAAVIAKSVVAQGFASIGTGWIAAIYVVANEDGSPLPDAMFQLPNDWASTAHPAPGKFLVVGGIGWEWYAPAALVAEATGNDPRGICQWMRSVRRSASQFAWMVGLEQRAAELFEGVTA